MPTPDNEAEGRAMRQTVELDSRDVSRIISSLMAIPSFIPAVEIEPVTGATVDDLERIVDDLVAQTGRRRFPKGITPEEYLKSLE